MPWSEVSVMDQRREFVRLALQEGVNRRELCRRFGISPDVAYKWLRRWQAGDRELSDQSRRPKRMPRRSAAAVEAQVVAVRDKHPVFPAPSKWRAGKFSSKPRADHVARSQRRIQLSSSAKCLARTDH